MKVIEVLFPEIANLYGDLQSVEFLRKSSKDISVVNDELNKEPYFVKNRPDMIFISSMTERAMELIANKLMPYKERLIELIEDGVYIFAIGNAFELFGLEIYLNGKLKQKGLGIFPTKSYMKTPERLNSLYLGKFNEDNKELTIVGFKSQFSTTEIVEDKDAVITDLRPVFNTVKGDGLSKVVTDDGIRYKNFFGTSLLGPLFILNPPFAKWFLSKIDIFDPLAFEKDAMIAYDYRVSEYSEPNRGFYY